MKISEVAENPTILDGLINKNIAPDDQMLAGENVQHYFSCGRDAIKKIACSSLVTGVSHTNILDFACGHGRVGRYLRAAFPNVPMTVSDVMQSAVDFSSKEFSATKHLSNTDFNSVHFVKKYSLIWSGSLMTHLDEEQAFNLLSLFEKSTEKDGLIIFTTHGRFVADMWKTGDWPYNLTKNTLMRLSKEFHLGAYAYSDYDHMNGYGISMMPLTWLMTALEKFPSLKLVTMMERGWDNHQDLIVLQKTPVNS